MSLSWRRFIWRIWKNVFEAWELFWSSLRSLKTFECHCVLLCATLLRRRVTELSNLCGLAQVRAVKKSCHAALVFSQGPNLIHPNHIWWEVRPATHVAPISATDLGILSWYLTSWLTFTECVPSCSGLRFADCSHGSNPQSIFELLFQNTKFWRKHPTKLLLFPELLLKFPRRKLCRGVVVGNRTKFWFVQLPVLGLYREDLRWSWQRLVDTQAITTLMICMGRFRQSLWASACDMTSWRSYFFEEGWLVGGLDQQTVRAEVRGVIQGLCRISWAIEFCGTTSHLVEATFGTAVCMVLSDRQEHCGTTARDGHCDFEIYPFGIGTRIFHGLNAEAS